MFNINRTRSAAQAAIEAAAAEATARAAEVQEAARVYETTEETNTSTYDLGGRYNQQQPPGIIQKEERGPEEEEEEDFRERLARSITAGATTTAAEIMETAVTPEQRIQESLGTIEEMNQIMNESGYGITASQIAIMERSIREIDQLRRIATGNPCVDVPEEANETSTPPTGNEPGPIDPDEPPGFESTPFLVPKQNIEKIISGADREVTVINRHLFDDDYWTYKPDEDGPTLPKDAYTTLKTDDDRDVDPFRYAAGKFWTFDEREEKFAKTDNAAGGDLPREVIFSTDTIQESFLEQTRQWYSILALEFNSGLSQTYVEAYVQGRFSPTFDSVPSSERPDFMVPLIEEDPYRPFVDSVFTAEQPFYKKELDKMQVSQFTSVDINPSVTTLDESEKEEIYMLSLYRSFIAKKNDEDIEKDCDYKDIIQKFPVEAVLQMNEANELAGSFNNFVEIEINTQQGTKVASLLHEFRMDKHVLDMLTSGDVNMATFTEVMDETLFAANQGEGDNAAIYQDISPLSINDEVRISAKERVLDDVGYRIKAIPNRTQQYYENMRTRQYPIPFENHDRPGLLRFADTLRSQMFLSKLNSYLTNDKFRSFSDILSGEKSYSEIIGYRVAKHEIIDDVLNPMAIQEFYFMDSDEVGAIRFIDTQIATGKQYLYRIHSINFVVGTTYEYGIEKMVSESDKFGESTAQGALLKAVTTPILRIIEAPFFERMVSTQEKPPMFPQVSFLPFQGVADKMQMLIESNFGESLQSPIQILESDAEVIARMRRAQDINFDSKIMYKNDSLPVSFQVFRLSEAPNTYSDFANADYVRTLTANGKTFLYLEDDFEPNKDYYYIFREVDTMGISNPTEVFRVKMVSYQNGIFMDLEAYEMQPREEQKIEICFEKALQIAPSLIQRSLKFADDADLDSREFALTVPDNVDIGNNRENSVWGRKFKARIISKTSGRRIDVNFKFVKNITKRELDTITEADRTDDSC